MERGRGGRERRRERRESEREEREREQMLQCRLNSEEYWRGTELTEHEPALNFHEQTSKQNP